MILHIGVLVIFFAGVQIVHSGRIRRQVPGSNLTLNFEWEDPRGPSTEADYYQSTEGAAFRRRRAAGGRPGHSTSNHTCSNIRGVPKQLRNASNIGPSGLSNFYQKYTEAYGIPVLASGNVRNRTLRRACYVLCFLLADHSAVRESFYRLSGRVAVIGAREETVSIPEHAYLGPAMNDRARGLGATENAPVSTGGEENILCYTEDRYSDEDIFLQELAKGIHLLGAKYAIPGWESRLQSLYDQAKAAGRWNNTYAMSTVQEYFAEGTQSYFNVNASSAVPDGIHNDVNTRDKLQQYDPQLFDLIQEVFPCGNTYLRRCMTSRRTCQDSNYNCKWLASQGECDASPDSMLLYCRQSCNTCGGDPCVNSNNNCSQWASEGECERNPDYMLTSCRRSCGQC